MNNYAFGNYIRDLREKKNLSQSELGKMLGVSNKAVSKWETGAAYPATELMLPLAEALGTTIEQLYTVITQSKKPPSRLRRFLDRIFSYSKIWLPIVTGIALLCHILFLIFGKSEQKLTLAVVAPLGVILFYPFLRFMLWFMQKNPFSSSGYIDFLEAVFLFAGVICFVQGLSLFLTDFIDGFSPMICFSPAILLALAQSHAKRVK